MCVCFRYQRVLCWIVCAEILIVSACKQNGPDKQSTNIGTLVDESVQKKAIVQSTILHGNPLVASDVQEALKYINKHPDFTAYHLLFAIREYYPKFYNDISNNTKATILCSALKHTRFLNDWGFLSPHGSFDRDSATALLETGESGLKQLTILLDDKESVRLFGSEEATMSETYMYRRSDFAYRYISLILREPAVFHADPKERDKDIEKLMAKLKKNSK
jgi:hypothetical protein